LDADLGNNDVAHVSQLAMIGPNPRGGNEMPVTTDTSFLSFLRREDDPSAGSKQQRDRQAIGA